jgi:transposase-like protein
MLGSINGAGPDQHGSILARRCLNCVEHSIPLQLGGWQDASSVAAREKAIRVIEKLRRFRLTKAAELAEAGIEETLTYYAFPEEHWRRIRTNNPLERLLREIRRRTRVVGAFPDGQSALNLAAARLRHELMLQ